MKAPVVAVLSTQPLRVLSNHVEKHSSLCFAKRYWNKVEHESSIKPEPESKDSLAHYDLLVIVVAKVTPKQAAWDSWSSVYFQHDLHRFRQILDIDLITL